MNLYQIANEYQHILDNLCNPETGEIDDSSMTALDKITDDIKNKGVAIASFIKNIEAEKGAIAEAKAAMAAREARLNRRAEQLKSYLRDNMERCGINEISCAYFAIKLKKNPPAVDVLDSDVIPGEFFNTKETITLDKMKVKRALIAGSIIPGVSLKQELSLDIR